MCTRSRSSARSCDAASLARSSELLGCFVSLDAFFVFSMSSACLTSFRELHRLLEVRLDQREKRSHDVGTREHALPRHDLRVLDALQLALVLRREQLVLGQLTEVRCEMIVGVRSTHRLRDRARRRLDVAGIGASMTGAGRGRPWRVRSADSDAHRRPPMSRRPARVGRCRRRAV